MSVGEYIKVRLPGETPWAIVTAQLPNGNVLARIANKPIRTWMHEYEYGDVASFEKVDDSGIWELVDLRTE